MDPLSIEGVMMFAQSKCPLGACAWPVAAGLAGLVIGIIVGRLSKGCGCKSGRKPRPRGGEAAVGGNKDCVEIYVGNLSYDTTEAQMRAEFEKFGSVLSARIITNRFNHKSKGFGFVEMPNRAEAEAAIKALNDKDIQGRKLRVNEAKNKSRE